MHRHCEEPQATWQSSLDCFAPLAMTEKLFSDGAGRLAGLAGALLGWRADEFWSATPAELAAVLWALVGEQGPAAGRDDLARLMEMFPDG